VAPPASPPALTGGLTVAQALGVSTLRDAVVLAGASGLDRVVQRLNVMEVPDILPWVKPHELLLTTAYPLRDAPGGLADLVVQLDARGLAGLAIKVGRYLDALPEEMLRRADELGFPIVRLPDDVGFDDILNQVLTDVLNQQAARLARSEAVHRALLSIVLSGGGLPEIAADLSELLAGPAAIVDTEGRILAEAGLDAVAPLLRQAGLLSGGTLTPADSGSGVVSTEDPPLRYLTAPISAGTRHHGRVVALEGGRPLSGEDLLALENAATVAALAITKAQAVAAVEAKFQSDFLHDLLNGRIDSSDDALTRAAALGWDLGRPLVLVVAEPEQGPSPAAEARQAHQRFSAQLAALARSRDPGAAVVDFSSEVVVITSSPADGAGGVDDREAARAVAAALAAGALPDRAVSYGVSRTVGGPLEIAAAYGQARKAVRIGRRIRGGPGVAHFDDLGTFRLLSLVDDPAELRAFADEALGALAEPTPEAADLRETLQVLLDTNLNIAESARRLHFHYNTLRYRLDKLQRLVGPFPDDPHVRLNLLIALQILRMRDAHAEPRPG
jgi:purine catabolism regulator